MGGLKPILFVDFDGVLCHDRYWRGMDKEVYDRIQELMVVGNRAMMDSWMRGKYTAEEINQFISNNLGIQYKKLWSVFVRDAQTMSVPTALLEETDRLCGRFQTVLITVNTDAFDRFTVPALGLDRHFDYIVNSWTDGRFKHEHSGSIFTDCAERLGSPIEVAYLLDDSERNCATFTDIGGTAYLVDADNSVERCLQHLQEVMV